MKKLLLIFIGFAILSILSCQKTDKDIVNSLDYKMNNSELISDYRSINVNNFTVDEIGKNHNLILNILLNNDLNGKSQIEYERILIFEMPQIENKFTSKDISNSITNFCKTITNINEKKSSSDDFTKNVFEFIFEKGYISEKAKDELNMLTNMDIIQMKNQTNILINSTSWTYEEKQYFAVFTSVYENSYIYWNELKSSNNQIASKASGKVYAADAAGAVLGLFWGPIWSIIQGALASYIVDDNGKVKTTNIKPDAITHA